MAPSRPSNIRVVFFGTNAESIPALRALLACADVDCVGVVTQPPRPVGRAQTLEASEVARLAEREGIPVVCPTKSSEIYDAVSSWRADVFVVVSYGCILPKHVLELPIHGAINVHPSLLPRWRGATPVPATIRAGDTQTGVTVILMDDRMDHGPILDQVALPTPERPTMPDLLMDLMSKGAERLPSVIRGLVDGTLQPVAQDEAGVTSCSLLSKEDGRIDWSQDAASIDRMIRAYTPWPGTWTMVEDASGAPKRFRILAAHVDPSLSSDASTIHVVNGRLACGNLVIDRFQLEGKTPLAGEAFATTHATHVWPHASSSSSS